ncbi:MAG TPA: cell division protein FtsZ [Methyloceanibacter sp.]|nr:cell division protein FtsZ [Methyloceanibacter sp.]
MSINLGVPDLTELKPRITVFGVGGAGGNAVNNMIASGLKGVEFVVANTDAQALASSSAERRIQMGAHVTEGLGAGSKPEIGAAAAEEAMADIKAHLVGCHMVFITAGMGGGTGTGAAPVIARASREEGILTVGVVTKPFQFEGARRMRAAEAGIEQLQKFVDTQLIIPNQNLFRVANEKTTFTDAFAMADDVLRAGVSCITDLMVKEGLINLDFADVRAVMAGMGKAMMGTGEATGDRRAIEAAEAAIANPLLDDVCMKGASGLLVSITGGNDLTLYEVDEAASRVRQEADPDANIIVGATFDDELDGSIRVSVVATGIGTAQIEMRPTNPQERNRLSARLAGLATLPGAPVDLDEPSLVLSETEMVKDSAVWRAPGNVTIEKRPAQVAAIAPVAMTLPKSAPQTQSRPFQPAPPVAIKRPVRRMPAMEDLPVVAQSEIKAKSGEVPVIGLAAQKKKVGFLERLANVGRLRKEDDETQAKREPEFERAWGELPKQAERPKAEPEAAPRGIRIERPRGEKVVAAVPKLVEVQAPPEAEERDVAPDESLVDDDLEIPAFLRRRAN